MFAWKDEVTHLGPWLLGATFLPPFLWAIAGNGNLAVWAASFVAGLALSLLLVIIALLYRVWEANQVTGEMLGEFLDTLKEERAQARMRAVREPKIEVNYRRVK